MPLCSTASSHPIGPPLYATSSVATASRPWATVEQQTAICPSGVSSRFPIRRMAYRWTAACPATTNGRMASTISSTTTTRTAICKPIGATATTSRPSATSGHRCGQSTSGIGTKRLCSTPVIHLITNTSRATACITASTCSMKAQTCRWVGFPPRPPRCYRLSTRTTATRDCCIAIATT